MPLAGKIGGKSGKCRTKWHSALMKENGSGCCISNCSAGMECGTAAAGPLRCGGLVAVRRFLVLCLVAFICRIRNPEGCSVFGSVLAGSCFFQCL